MKLNLRNKFNIVFLLQFFVFSSALAQNSEQDVEMAKLLYQNGKIYVVVFILATIFAGIIFYLIRLEKKLNKLEKNNPE